MEIKKITLDDKDRKILEILQKDGRATLKEIGGQVNLSIDSVHKRLKKLLSSGVISKIGAFLEPPALGFEMVAVVQIKLHNISQDEHDSFISYLVNSKHTIEVISTLGRFDITCVFIAKKAEDLEKIYRGVRHDFREIIADWESTINLKVHKFEEYNLF